MRMMSAIQKCYSHVNKLKNRIVLIDDDPFFGEAMVSYGKSRNLKIDYFPSLSDLGFVSLLGNYDAAILDLHLDNISGLDIAKYIESLFQKLPVVLISADNIASDLHLPKVVSRFIHKRSGIKKILDEAQRVSCMSPTTA